MCSRRAWWWPGRVGASRGGDQRADRRGARGARGGAGLCEADKPDGRGRGWGGAVGFARAAIGGRRATAAAAEPMANLLAPLMAMIVLPYLGQAAATRETARPAPRRRRVVAPRQGDPLRELDMRLTYRTVRVLLAIAAIPGESIRATGRSPKRRVSGSGPDLQAARAPRAPRFDRERWRGHCAESRTCGG